MKKIQIFDWNYLLMSFWAISFVVLITTKSNLDILRSIAKSARVRPPFTSTVGCCDCFLNPLNASQEEIDAEKEKIAEIDELILKLRDLNESSREARELAETKLAEKGYKIIKIPAFTETYNFMNGVGGTSTKTGETFYITNESEIPELEDFIREKFEAAGIDKVYFVSTTDLLEDDGGIDCLTQGK